MSVKDFLLNQTFLYDWLRMQKILCSYCDYKKKPNPYITIKFDKYFISMKCAHKIVIIYPPSEERKGAWFWREVSLAKHKEKVDSHG